jgi:hypothetical protein
MNLAANLRALDERDPISQRQLLPAILPIYAQRCSHHPLSPQEV